MLVSGKAAVCFKSTKCWRAELIDLNFTNLVEKKVVDVVSEKSSQLALLSLTWPHVHLYFLDESEQNSPKKKENIISQLQYTFGD